MAGDWIKVENVTPDKPEVDIIAEFCGIHPDHAMGALLRLWIRADEQTVDGNAASVTKSWINRCAGVPNFADGMERAGWLVVRPDGLCFPNFARHNGNPAKQRALTSKRVAEHKKRKGNAASVTSALPREEKRRDNRLTEDASLPSEEKTQPKQTTTEKTDPKQTRGWWFLEELQKRAPSVITRTNGKLDGRLLKLAARFNDESIPMDEAMFYAREIQTTWGPRGKTVNGITTTTVFCQKANHWIDAYQQRIRDDKSVDLNPILDELLVKGGGK